MAFTRPTLQQLINRNQADIEASIPGADAKLRRTNINVLAKILSATAHGLYGFLDYIAKQILPDTADTDYLDRHATLWLAQARKPAAYATGAVVFSGTNGTLIPLGTVLTTTTGLEYETDSDGTIASGQAIINVTASNAGQAGNLLAGTQLNLSSPIAGITGNTFVHTGGLTGGADAETDDALRARVLTRIKQAPHGGADFDYVTWALEVPGVTRAWVYPQELGLGTVVVRFVRDNDANLIPDAGEVATTNAYIQARRPVTAQVTVVAPIANALNFNIAVTPNTPAVKASVEAELRDLIQREAIPGGTLLLSHIREAISIAAGETNYTMTSPNADVTNTTGNISTFGAITWS